MGEKQVDKEHYHFSKYVDKPRWASMWHQLNEVLSVDPKTVLEVGPGPGLFKVIASAFGINVETLDFDPELKPNYVASATSMPFRDGAYDVVCAFQMLEHLPYERALRAFEEMARVSERFVLLSLPDAKHLWRFQCHIPKLGPLNLFVARPRLRPLVHIFDGQHYWEINKKGYPLSRIVDDLACHIPLIRTYRVHENPYHRFFVFKHTSVLR